MEKSVLVIDDDAKLRKLLSEYLSGYGFDVDTLEDGSRIMETVVGTHPDLVILDVMLPDRDGFDILRELRATNSYSKKVPVIMLTAKGEDEDRIVGLEMGADDYLPKPFNPRELLARMKAILRRLEEPVAENGDADILSVGDISLDPSRLTLTVGSDEMELSTTEIRLMQALMGHAGKALSREQLMTLGWGREYSAYDRSIDVHISRLRAKLALFEGHEKRIRTVWGTGYMFVEGK